MNEELRKEIERDIPLEYRPGVYDVLKSVPPVVQRDAYLRLKQDIDKKISNR
jgi:hypothetical protein